jgi:hypothetical protein
MFQLGVDLGKIFIRNTVKFTKIKVTEQLFSSLSLVFVSPHYSSLDNAKSTADLTAIY